MLHITTNQTGAAPLIAEDADNYAALMDIVSTLRAQGDDEDADMLLLAASGVDFYEEVRT